MNRGGPGQRVVNWLFLTQKLDGEMVSLDTRLHDARQKTSDSANGEDSGAIPDTTCEQQRFDVDGSSELGATATDGHELVGDSVRAVELECPFTNPGVAIQREGTQMSEDRLRADDPSELEGNSTDGHSPAPLCTATIDGPSELNWPPRD